MRWTALAVFAIALPLLAQTKVETKIHETFVLQINGATAAYAIDESIANAGAHDGVVTIFGKSAGSTRVMVIAFGRTLTYDVVVIPQTPRTSAVAAMNAEAPRRVIAEARYLSTTGQVQTTVDSAAIHAVLLHDRQRTSIPAASIQIGKNLTLLDKRVDETPLTTTNASVRGIHFFNDAWRVHAGVTSSTFYDSFVLPVHRRFVFGASRSWRLSDRWRVMPNLYGSNGGAIASVIAEYADGERLRTRTEIGYSRGFGGAFQLAANGATSHIRADLKWQPRNFATIGENDVRGFIGDVAASRTIGKLDVDAAATKTHTMLGSFEERTVTSTIDLRYHIARPLTLLTGASYGSFGSSIHSFNVPVGVAANFGRGGFSAIYRIGDNTSRGRSNGFRVSGNVSRAGVHASAFVDRQNDAPTIAIFADRYPELASDLARAGINATSVADIARLLREASVLASLGITTAPHIDLALHRQQAGGDVAWRELRLRYIRSDVETVSARSTTTFTTLTWTHRLPGATDLEASYGMWTTGHRHQPAFELALRHRFDSFPSFAHGDISGSVYRDDENERTPLGGVEVQLDDEPSTRTDNAGRYAFKHVGSSAHRVVAHLPADDSYFTTPSHATVQPGEHVDFGVAFSPARLNVTIVDDSGRGVNGVHIAMSGGTRRLGAISDSEGNATFAVQPGTWTASIDDASLAAGYAIDGNDSREIALERAHAATIQFAIHANRSIYGRIEGARARTDIEILPGHRHVATDENGRFAIRSLPAGVVTLHTRVKGAVAQQSITLPAEPTVIDDFVLAPH